MKTLRYLLLASLLMLLHTSGAYAQWVETNGPSLGTVYSFGVTGTSIFAGTGQGVFRSIDNGQSWRACGSWYNSWQVEAFLVYGSSIYAASGRIMVSSDDGRTWQPSTTGLDGDGGDPCTFATIDTVLFVGMRSNGGDLYRSTDFGASWNHAESGLTDMTVQTLAVMGTTLFAGTTGSGVFRSTNKGTNWSHVVTGLTDTSILTLAVSGSNLFAGTDEGHVFLSTNAGTNWTQVGTDLPAASVRSLVVGPAGDGTGRMYLFAGTSAGAYRSLDNGVTWTAINSGLSDTNFYSLAFVPRGNGTDSMMLLAGTGRDGVVRSIDNGGSWITSVLPNSIIDGIGTTPTALLASVYPSGLYRSGDEGATWTLAAMTGTRIYSFAALGARAFCRR